jgi:pimeloyl-ACP methyl ester carboxylesterase
MNVSPARPAGVVRAAPPSPPGCVADLVVADLPAVTAELRLERFAVLGYSLSGAVAAWLARASDRVTAVVAAGSRCSAATTRLLADVESRVAAGEHDPTGRAATDAEFDNRAAVAFYRDLARLPDGALVDDVSCPMFSFCGEHDEIINTLGSGVEHLCAALRQRDITTTVLPGLDHLGALLEPEPALAEIIRWLTATNPPHA